MFLFEKIKNLVYSCKKEVGTLLALLIGQAVGKEGEINDKASGDSR